MSNSKSSGSRTSDAEASDRAIIRRGNKKSTLFLRNFKVPYYKESRITNKKYSYNRENKSCENPYISEEVKIIERDIKLCRVLLTDCLSKKEERRNSQTESESIYETCSQADKLWSACPEVGSTDSQNLFKTQYYKVAQSVSIMSDISKGSIHRNDNKNNFVSPVSNQSQTTRRTFSLVSETYQFHPNISEDNLHTLDSAETSTPSKNMHKKHHYTRPAIRDSKTSLNYPQSVRRRLPAPIWLWIVFLSLLALGVGYIIGFLFFFSTADVQNTVIDDLSETSINNIIKKTEEALTLNDILLRISMLEKEQINQKQYLINITNTLENHKKRHIDFHETFNDIDTANKISTDRLTSFINNNLQLIKEELRNLTAEMESLSNNHIKMQVKAILSNYFPLNISKENLMENISTSFNSNAQTMNDNFNDSNTNISEELIRNIVKEVLKIYDADKTGQVDYALESAGGQIISTRDTQEYNVESRAFKLFGWTWYYRGYNNNPRVVIQNSMQPGKCWAFHNFPGRLLIQLPMDIYVTGFTMEHVSRLILPNGDISSAPKNFKVWGLIYERDPTPEIFGDYEFVKSDDNLQYFPVQNTAIKRPYEFIELRIHSNHGQANYTCLYKFRVHGNPI